MYRRGTADQRRKKRQLRCGYCCGAWNEGSKNPGLVRIDEAENCVVHDECWEDHLGASSEEPLQRGMKELGVLWSRYVRHADQDETRQSQTPFRPRHDLTCTTYYQDIQEAFSPNKDLGHCSRRRATAKS